MVDELRDSDVSASTVDALRTSHTEVLHSTTNVAVRSLFASSVRELGRDRETALVLILDEFDDVFCALPPWPFRQLRALRDALGARLCYVTATSRRLERLRSDADTYEFRELFDLHTRILRPLSQGDARRFVAYLCHKQGAVLDEERISMAVELSGGHPGLLERTYSILRDTQPDPAAELRTTVVELSGRRAIQKECRRLWDELEAQEQEGLLILIGAGAVALGADQRQALEMKGLVVAAEGGGLAVFSPIFEAFVQGEWRLRRQAARRGVHCDLQTGQIWVDDREVTLELSELQRKLVMSLYQKAGAVCTQDEIVEAVWGVGSGVSDGAIYELIKRVRQKLEPDWKNPRYIVTVPGVGYRLQTP
jgi:DNA-binding winged helix-turn-helix (wHTH) protein